MYQVNYRGKRVDIDATADGAARNKVRFDSKAELLAGGASVMAVRYQRASQDKKEYGKSVEDQGVLNAKGIRSHGWTDSASFTDNDRSASRHATKVRDGWPAGSR